jgi:hypothetical protein
MKVKISGATRRAKIPVPGVAIKTSKTDNSEERMWGELEDRLKVLQPKDVKAILVGFEGKVCDDLLAQLREIGVGQTASISSVEGLRSYNNLWKSFEVVLVNHDDFKDARDAVDTLIEFRKRVPGKRIILISSLVSRDDVGPERRPICDVTLRAPGTIERLSNNLNP